MTILVDELIDYQMPHLPIYLRGLWCHMMTDDLTPNGLDELHAMAERLGLQRAWFQDKPHYPHYDLRPNTRALAIQLGAQAVTGAELIRRCWRPD
jgi:hypothetical protein